MKFVTLLPSVAWVMLPKHKTFDVRAFPACVFTKTCLSPRYFDEKLTALWFKLFRAAKKECFPLNKFAERILYRHLSIYTVELLNRSQVFKTLRASASVSLLVITKVCLPLASEAIKIYHLPTEFLTTFLEFPSSHLELFKI